MDRGVEIWLAWMFIDAPDSNNETPRLWHDTHTSLVFIGPHVIPVYNPRCSKLLHTRARRRGGGGRWSPLVHTSPASLVYIIYRTYIRSSVYIYVRCTHYSGAGESTRQHSVAAGLRQDILDGYSYRRNDVISILLVGRLLAANSTIWKHRRILL